MPRRKSWTVIVYIVARNLARNADAKYLNTKAEEVVEELKKAAYEFSDDLYVAYQVVFDPNEGRNENWVAELLNATDGQPTTHDGEFTNPGVLVGETLTDDLLGFYAWALPRCPADHLAAFFWGHSAGPAGLFRPASRIVVPHPPPPPTPRRGAPIAAQRAIPSLTISGIRDVLRRTRRVLTREFLIANSVEQLSQWILTAPIDEPVLDRTGAPVKVDIVLFQDCWMSTLETAFQLKDAAHFVVASQSQVPFGRPSVCNDCQVEPTERGAGVWPYGRLFGALRSYDSNSPRDSFRSVVTILGSFYDDARNIWPNPSVPFTLLDLDKINSGGIGSFDTDSLNNLVAAIMRLMPGDERAAKKRRAHYIQKASIAVAGNLGCRRRRDDPKTELIAGSIALVDVISLCKQLEADPRLTPDELGAVKGLINSDLVVICNESIYRATGLFPPDDPKYSFEITCPDEPAPHPPRSLKQSLGFQGISALYYPTKTRTKRWGKRDENIFNDLVSDFYNELTLSKETHWAKLALEQIPDA